MKKKLIIIFCIFLIVNIIFILAQENQANVQELLGVEVNYENNAFSIENIYFDTGYPSSSVPDGNYVIKLLDSEKDVLNELYFNLPETPSAADPSWFDPKTGEVKIQIKDYDPQFLSMRAVNTVSGETTLLNYEKKYSIADGKEHIWTPHTKLDSLNTNQWDEEKLKIFGYQKEIEELNQKVNLKQKQNEAIKATGLDHDKEYAETLARNERDVTRLREHIDNVHTYLSSSVSEAYNKFKKSTTTTKDQGLLEEAKNFEKKR